MKRKWGIAVLVAVSLVIAACGGDDDDASEGAEEVAYDPDGVVHWTYDLLTRGGFQFDPPKSPSGGYEPMPLVFGQLMTRDEEGKYVPGLANSATLVDEHTMEIELRPGLTFSDGSKLDAAALKAAIERNITMKGPGFSTDLFDVTKIDVVDTETVRLTTTKPTAGAVFDLLSYPEFLIVSAAAAASGVDMGKAPVGAGPFMVESFEPGARIKLKKNPNYYDADDIKLAGVEIVHSTAGAPLVNGLLAGQIDVAPIAVTDIDALSSNDAIETEVTSTHNIYGQMYMCKSKPPFNDVKVRQALEYATDREALMNAVDGGHGEPAWGLWPEGHLYYDESLEDSYPYDPDQAEELLADAGYANGLSFNAFVTVGDAVSQKTAEVLQEMWRKVGVQVSLVPTPNFVADFFQAVKEPAWVSNWSGGGNRRVARIYVPGPVSNVCQYSDPELTALVDELKAVDPTSPEGVEIWKEIQQYESEHVLAVKLNFRPAVNAWNADRIGGVEIAEDVFAYPRVDITKLYVKQ